jgi:hypothetical protein
MTVNPDMNSPVQISHASDGVATPADRILGAPQWPVYVIGGFEETDFYVPSRILRIASTERFNGDQLRIAVGAMAGALFHTPDSEGIQLVRVTVTEISPESRIIYDENGPLPEIDRITPSEGRFQSSVVITGRNLCVGTSISSVRVILGPSPSHLYIGAPSDGVITPERFEGNLYSAWGDESASGPHDVTVITAAGSAVVRNGFTILP